MRGFAAFRSDAPSFSPWPSACADFDSVPDGFRERRGDFFQNAPHFFAFQLRIRTGRNGRCKTKLPGFRFEEEMKRQGSIFRFRPVRAKLRALPFQPGKNDRLRDALHDFPFRRAGTRAFENDPIRGRRFEVERGACAGKKRQQQRGRERKKARCASWR